MCRRARPATWVSSWCPHIAKFSVTEDDYTFEIYIFGMSQFERSALLGRECAEAESIVRTIVNQETTENWPLSWDESPLKPWIIDQANTLLIYRMKKTAFFYGSLTGTGIMFTRYRSVQTGTSFATGYSK